MENLILTRIDDRLIHGQVMTAWMKVMPAKKIIIVDDKVAADDFMKDVLEMAAPAGVKMNICSVEQAIGILDQGLSVPTIMLAKTPLTLKALIDGGVELKAINIGGIGMKEGRKTLYKNIAVTEEERQILKDFIQKGIDVKIQIIPAEKVIDLKNIL
ncbi:PTS sugar transporter subunit IIB [Clostridium sp. KNHs216]|uniref:PTS sugar transporter subunit IIB n=1 Tax=Clostridium sp. KNHs216 TaxID=1550235 RepID=UPI00114F7672|nr:PTS sugar transporter subunit IIB [Clostridium sp. KNHs216]TQI68259.1 PTS system mannose-specific IIB component [Clostridium sp. KNHs216]